MKSWKSKLMTLAAMAVAVFVLSGCSNSNESTSGDAPKNDKVPAESRKDKKDG